MTDFGTFEPDRQLPPVPQDASLRDFEALTRFLPPDLSALDQSTSSNDPRLGVWNALGRIVDPGAKSPLLPETYELREVARRSVYWSTALLGTVHGLLWQFFTGGLQRVVGSSRVARLARSANLTLATGQVGIGSDTAFGVSVEGPPLLVRTLFGDGPQPLQSVPVARAPWVTMPPHRWPRELPLVVSPEARPDLDLHSDQLGFGRGRAASHAEYGSEPAIGQLGCKHVLDNLRLGDAVPLANGGTGEIVALGADGIDLAVVSDPSRPWSRDRRTPRQVQWWPAPSMPCELEGTSSVHTRVHRVGNEYGVFDDPMLPVHVDIEAHGTPGDSGSAVIDETTGGILGVYRGRIRNPGPFDPGRCVHIQQAIAMLGITLVE